MEKFIKSPFKCLRHRNLMRNLQYNCEKGSAFWSFQACTPQTGNLLSKINGKQHFCEIGRSKLSKSPCAVLCLMLFQSRSLKLQIA